MIEAQRNLLSIEPYFTKFFLVFAIFWNALGYSLLCELERSSISWRDYKLFSWEHWYSADKQYVHSWSLEVQSNSYYNYHKQFQEPCHGNCSLENLIFLSKTARDKQVGNSWTEILLQNWTEYFSFAFLTDLRFFVKLCEAFLQRELKWFPKFNLFSTCISNKVSSSLASRFSSQSFSKSLTESFPRHMLWHYSGFKIMQFSWNYSDSLKRSWLKFCLTSSRLELKA